MRITKDPVLDSWELAESDEDARVLQGGPFKPCNPYRILVVDDEESVRGITIRILESNLGPVYQYDQATNGEDAVRLFSQMHHKVILLDLSMPVLDGEQAANQILDICDQTQWETPAIIFRTGYAPPGNVRNMVACDPAHCLLRKPVRNQTLIKAVRGRLGLN
jgi:CheY-like chemotaxis protein